MAHGQRAKIHGNRRTGREYWTPRPGNKGGGAWGPTTKRFTHRIERRLGKVVEREEMNDCLRLDADERGYINFDNLSTSTQLHQ